MSSNHEIGGSKKIRVVNKISGGGGGGLKFTWLETFVLLMNYVVFTLQ